MTNPINEQHCATCRDVEQKATELIDFAEKCKDCGLPVDEYLEQLKLFRDTAAKLRSTFHPTSV